MMRKAARVVCVLALVLWAAGCGKGCPPSDGGRRPAAVQEDSPLEGDAEAAPSEVVSPAPSANEISTAPAATQTGATDVPIPKPAADGAPATDAGAADLRPIPEIRVARDARGGTDDGSAPEADAAPDDVAATTDEPETERMLDDFEGRLRWEPITWDNANDCDVSLAEVEGGRSLLLLCKGGERDKAGAALALNGSVDFSPFSALSADVAVEGEDEVDVAIALESPAYYESPRQTIKTGADGSVVFSLVAANYKTAPAWKQDSVVAGLAAVRTLYVLVYSRGEVRVRLENVRLLQQLPEATADEGE
ncbi:MAG TPA: hypothetical protein VNA25_27070 [Phycisphaerae bacterium]|nr:hypothetical protein [Phycisphaerae bacterium]